MNVRFLYMKQFFSHMKSQKSGFFLIDIHLYKTSMFLLQEKGLSKFSSEY